MVELEAKRGGKGGLVIGFPLGLSLFLPVESSCWHPVKKFDQKNGECLVWKNRSTISTLHLCGLILPKISRLRKPTA